MLLSDLGIWRAINEGDLDIQPLPSKDAVQPASVDLHLSPWFRHFRTPHAQEPVDPKIGHTYRHISRLAGGDGGSFVLEPREFILCSTAESVRLGPRLAARIEGKSSIGRLGISIHVTAGFIDPGFEGFPTLEVVNFLNRPIRLTPGMPICQLAFHLLDREASHPYNERGSYRKQGQAPEPSRYWVKYGTEEA